MMIQILTVSVVDDRVGDLGGDSNQVNLDVSDALALQTVQHLTDQRYHNVSVVLLVVLEKKVELSFVLVLNLFSLGKFDNSMDIENVIRKP